MIKWSWEVSREKQKAIRKIWDKRKFRINPGSWTRNYSSYKRRRGQDGGCVESSKKGISPELKEVCFQIEVDLVSAWKINEKDLQKST